MKNDTGFKEKQEIHLAGGRRFTIDKLAYVPEVTPFGGWWVVYRDYDPKHPRQKVTVTCMLHTFRQLVEESSRERRQKCRA